MLDLIYMACTVLLPVIPAYLLFKALGSAGTATGQLLGMKIKLGGAFAGYFSVLILIFMMYNVWHPTYNVWKIHGTVTDEKGDQVGPLGEKDVFLIPGNFQLYPDDGFDLTFAAPRGDYPTLVVSYPNFQSITLKLDPNSKAIKSDGGGHLTIVNPFALHKLPSYVATGAAPAAVPVSQAVHQ